MARSALSPVQETVMSLRSQGLGTKKIAEKLGLSESTVKTHLRRAQAKISNPRDTALPDDGLQEILKELEPECSLNTKVETLARIGLSPSRIAHVMGASQGTVRQILYRQRQKERQGRDGKNNGNDNEEKDRERARSYRLGWEEWEEYRKQAQKNQPPKDEIAFLYKIYVEIGLDNLKPEALALLGTQGLGGWKGRRAVFRVRKDITHGLALSGRVAAEQWNSRRVAEEIKEIYGGPNCATDPPDPEEPFRPTTGCGTVKA
ncbi:MAG: sigma factor-like helix-turn-helix DNA-binding protein, partial [Moorellaceae bacterium]